MGWIRRWAAVAAATGCLVVLLSGVVRITASGAGCAGEWPLCRGRLVPTFDDPTTTVLWIQRLALALAAASTAALAVAARGKAPAAALRSVAATASLMAALLALDWLLTGPMRGTVPGVATLHTASALAFVAAAVVSGLAAAPAREPRPPATVRARRGAAMALAAGGVTTLLGTLTADAGAAAACLGFPLCDGRLWPAPGAGPLAHLHWVHRLAAYGMTLLLLWLAAGDGRERAPPSTLPSLAVTLVAAQLAAAAAMMLTVLDAGWRALHVALGTALWVTLVAWWWQVRPDAPRPATGRRRVEGPPLTRRG